MTCVQKQQAINTMILAFRPMTIAPLRTDDIKPTALDVLIDDATEDNALSFCSTTCSWLLNVCVQCVLAVAKSECKTPLEHQ